MNMAEIVQERMKGSFPDLLGIQMIEATPDLVRASLTVRPDLCTAGNILHGGAIMAFADTLGAVATVLNIPPGARTATIESKTNFLKPAPLGTKVIGESTALHRGRKTMTWQAKVFSENEMLLAFVTQTQLILD